MIIKDEIKNFLAFNRNKYFKGVEIANYINERWGMNITDLEVRDCIKDLRLEGNIIIAGHNGYCLTNNEEEIHKYLSSRWGELTREMKSLKSIAYSCNMLDQLKLWENENE